MTDEYKVYVAINAPITGEENESIIVRCESVMGVANMILSLEGAKELRDSLTKAIDRLGVLLNCE